MFWDWIPLVGILLFLVAGCWWRPWLHARRYGSSGLFLFRSGQPSQHVRDTFAVLLAVLLTAQAAITTYPPPSLVWRTIGAVLLCGGVVLLVAAQLTLGASWRVGIEEDARPGLVTTGLYRLSRNPIFLAMLIAVAGYAVLLPTRLSLVLLAGAYVGIRAQIHAEEEYLLRAYGDAYRAYGRRVGRLLPGIGRFR
jgi:protein-S-isoprenylcysteine O-methyltransferase Ste14